MKRLTTTLFATTFILTACSGQPNKDQITKILEENPEIIVNSIKKNPALYFEAISLAARESQQQIAKQRAEREEKKLLESFDRPLTPSVTQKDAIRGPQDAPITLVSYSDFECPFCTRGNQVVEELKKKYPGKIRVVYKHLPLSFHPQARISAQYFEAIKLQSTDKAFEFHDKIFENQRKLGQGEKFLKKLAKELEINMKKLNTDLQSKEVISKIERDETEAKKFGFQGTPGFILNGIPIKGAYPLAHFEKIISELQRRRSVKI